MLSLDGAIFIVIDIQGNLAGLMHEKDRLFENTARLVRGARALDIPVLWTEQLPDKLGPTVEPVAEALVESGGGVSSPIIKSAFSCMAEPAFREALESSGRRQVIVAGIEAHVCVSQTVLEMLELGYEVFTAADCISSRTQSNRRTGLRRMEAAGAKPVSVESCLFELIRDAKHPAFKTILGIIK